MALLAREVLAGRMRFLDFVDRVGSYETGDAQVDEVIDLLEHQPAASGWAGAGKEVHDEYTAGIERLIEALEADA